MRATIMEIVDEFHSLSLENRLESIETESVELESSDNSQRSNDESISDDEKPAAGSSEDNTTSESSVNLAKNGQPKKRVQFMTDDLLVRVQVIPAREHSPLSEELQPCDPSTLAVDLNDVHLDNVLPKRAVQRRPLSIRRQPRRTSSRSGSSRANKPALVKPLPPPAKISPAVRRLYGAALPRASNNSDTCKKRLAPNAPVRQSSFVSISSVNRPQSHVTDRTDRASSRIDLDMSPLRSNSAHSLGTSCSSFSSTSSSASSLSARVQHSPYRQSSASSMSPSHFSSLRNLSLRPSSSSQPGGTGLDGTSSRQYASSLDCGRDRLLTNGYSGISNITREVLYKDSDRSQSFRGFRAVPVSAKKVFAWNMANAQLPHVDTPSISPMWDTSPNPSTKTPYTVDTSTASLS